LGSVEYFHLMAVHYRAHGPAQYGISDLGHEMHEGRRQTRRRSADAGSRLKLIDVSGRSRLIHQPSSRTRENPLSARKRTGEEDEDVRIGILSTRSRGLNSLSVKVSQPTGSEPCLGDGNITLEA